MLHHHLSRRWLIICLLVTLAASSMPILSAAERASEGDRLIQPVSTVQPAGTLTPTAVTPVDQPDSEGITNILVLGSDTDNPVNAGRTDAIMIVSVNPTLGSVHLLSIPRDLYVYVPGWTTQRINTVFGHGERNPDTGGGATLLKETIRHNLGLSIDFYVRVDFNDFRSIIDALGGIEITVDCALQDWQLKDPTLDPSDEASWELVTLPVGVHVLDGYEALWYSRSRRTSSDFDRGRRQQDVIRAIWRRANSLGLLNQLPALWGELQSIVTTDMMLLDLLELAPLALTLDSSRIHHFTFVPEQDVKAWRSPEGAAVQVPVAEEIEQLAWRFLQPVTDHQFGTGGARVDVLNATGYPSMDRVAADLLAWDGFRAVAAGADPGGGRARTTVYDYSGRQKGSQLEALLTALRVGAEAVIVQPNAESEVDYRVVLGSDYRSCRHGVLPPVPTALPDESAE